MVKAVVGEELQLKSAEDRLSQAALPSEVGLVIGKLSKNLDRGFIFDLIPTPQNDAGEPASSVIDSVKDDNKKKGSKSKAQSDSSLLFIDKDWIAEHARQVSRMLPGGTKVIGVYVWVSESIFKNSTMILCQTVKGVSQAAPSLETDSEERLLIHISFSPRRWTCRNCSLASNITTSSLRPCDFKMGKVLTSLQAFRCMYNFDFRLPICLEKGSSIRKFSDIVRRGLSVHAKMLKGAKALIDGRLVCEDEQCAQDDLHEVEFLLPFMQDKSLEAYSQNAVVGLLLFSGTVCSFAYLNAKEPISQALDDMKEDIIMSLQSRLDILCDEAADQESESIIESDERLSDHRPSEKHIPELDVELQRKCCSLPFPRRVFVPWLGSMYICDYIQPSETIEVLKDHFVEVMSMEPPKDVSTILEPETENPVLLASTMKSFWDLGGRSSRESDPGNSTAKYNERATNKETEQKAARLLDFNLIAAALVLTISIVIGLVLFVFRS